MIRRVARCDGRMVCYPNRGVATQIGSTGRCRERLWRQRRGDRPRFRANLRLHSGECHVVTGWSSSGRSGARGRSRPGSSAVAHWSGRGGGGRDCMLRIGTNPDLACARAWTRSREGLNHRTRARWAWRPCPVQTATGRSTRSRSESSQSSGRRNAEHPSFVRSSLLRPVIPRAASVGFADLRLKQRHPPLPPHAVDRDPAVRPVGALLAERSRFGPGLQPALLSERRSLSLEQASGELRHLLHAREQNRHGSLLLRSFRQCREQRGPLAASFRSGLVVRCGCLHCVCLLRLRSAGVPRFVSTPVRSLVFATG